jgi:hypothetical protein
MAAKRKASTLVRARAREGAGGRAPVRAMRGGSDNDSAAPADTECGRARAREDCGTDPAGGDARSGPNVLGTGRACGHRPAPPTAGAGAAGRRGRRAA